MTRFHAWAALVALTAGTVALGGAARAPQDPASLASPLPTGNGPGGIHFSGRLDRNAVRVGGDGQVRLELSIKAPADDGEGRTPADLVVVLDRSGSMAGAKIEHARAAVRHLLGALTAEDRLALVSYAHGARLDVPLARAGAVARARWIRTLHSIAPGGGTNLSAGLDRALDLVDRSRSEGRVPRVILISDGLANEGDTSRHGLRARADRAARGAYALSTIGVGLEFDEELLALLADVGSGNYHYVETAAQLESIFAAEFVSARKTVASALRVVVRPGAGVSLRDASGYPLIPGGDEVAFHPGVLFSGQDRRIWLRFEVPGNAAGPLDLASLRLEYTHDGARHAIELAEAPRVARVHGEAAFIARIDRRQWARSVVVDRYNALKRSVSRAVASGDRDRARELIQDWGQGVAAMNRQIAAPEVAAQLEELEELEARIEESFRGDDAPARQKALGKALHHEGVVGGRAGSRLEGR